MEIFIEGELRLGVVELHIQPQRVSLRVADDLELAVVGPIGMGRGVAQRDAKMGRIEFLDPRPFGAQRPIEAEVLDAKLGGGEP